VNDELICPASIKGGQLYLTHRRYFDDRIRTWPDCQATVILRRDRAKTSDLQRAYWFAVVVPMVAEETGDDEDSVHEDLKRLFVPKATKTWRNRKTGKRRQRTERPSIMALTTKQMTELIDRTRQWAGEFLQLEIPPPDHRWRERSKGTAV